LQAIGQVRLYYLKAHCLGNKESQTMARQVMCINKRGNHYAAHERIQAIGGVANGYRWKDAEAVAIANVERDPTSYYQRERQKRLGCGGVSQWAQIPQDPE
jgi:hypothetical protein